MCSDDKVSVFYLRMSLFFLYFEVVFQIWYSWLAFFFSLSTLMIPFYFLLAYNISAKKSTNNLWKFPYTWWVAFLLLLLGFFVFVILIIICLSVVLFWFILTEAFCASSIWISIYYLIFEGFQPLFLKISSLPHSLFCPFKTFIMLILGCLIVSHKSFRHSSLFFIFPPSDSQLSYYLSSSSPILSSY